MGQWEKELCWFQQQAQVPTGNRLFINIFMMPPIAHPVLQYLRNGQLLAKQTEFQDSECTGTVIFQPFKPTLYCPQEKGATENQMVRWNHQLSGHEFERTLGDGEEQGGLECCSPWGHRVGHDWATEQQYPKFTTTWIQYLHLTFRDKWTWDFQWFPLCPLCLWVYSPLASHRVTHVTSDCQYLGVKGEGGQTG